MSHSTFLFGIQTFINACQKRFSSIQQHSARLVHGTLLEPLHVTYHFLSCMCQPAPSEVALIARATRHPTLGFSHVHPKLQRNHATSTCSHHNRRGFGPAKTAGSSIRNSLREQLLAELLLVHLAHGIARNCLDQLQVARQLVWRQAVPRPGTQIMESQAAITTAATACCCTAAAAGAAADGGCAGCCVGLLWSCFEGCNCGNGL